MTGTIPQIAKDSIKWYLAKKGQEQELGWYVRSMVNCWDMDGFKNKQECEYAYTAYRIARQIRSYCRRNKITTRKGSYYSTNQRQDPKLWSIVGSFDIGVKADGMSWRVCKVDQLRNVQIWF